MKLHTLMNCVTGYIPGNFAPAAKFSYPITVACCTTATHKPAPAPGSFCFAGSVPRLLNSRVARYSPIKNTACRSGFYQSTPNNLLTHTTEDVIKHAKGFTLIELMVVVAVIGILAMIAIPAYGDYVIRGKLMDATAGLSDGRIQMEQFFQDNKAYNAAGSPCPANTKYFHFACNTAATTYTITATGQGNLGAFTYSIDQTNTKLTAGLKAGWGTVPASCWITSKGASC